MELGAFSSALALVLNDYQYNNLKSFHLALSTFRYFTPRLGRALMMGVVSTSEMLVNFYEIRQHNILQTSSSYNIWSSKFFFGPFLLHLSYIAF